MATVEGAAANVESPQEKEVALTPSRLTTINLCLAAARRVAYEAADSRLLSPELAAGYPPRERSSPARCASSELAHGGSGRTVAEKYGERMHPPTNV